MRYYLLVILSSLSLILKSQNCILSGFIRDSISGELLIGANIYDIEKNIGCSTNGYGFFSLSFAASDTSYFCITYIGYKKKVIKITNQDDHSIDIFLSSGQDLREVVISGTKVFPIENRNEISTISLPASQIMLIPALGGESDIMKALQLTPGIKFGNEATSGIYVRGGSPDQNLILLDDVPLYYINHLGGFVSLFNTDAVNELKVVKGGFPARYGSRLSSILDVKLKEGNTQKVKSSVMLGMVASTISVDGPINNKSSFIVSYRRFLYDLIARPLSKVIFEGSSIGYNFYDLNLKFNYVLNPKNRLLLSFYAGDDKTVFKNTRKNSDLLSVKNKIKWGNVVMAFRWNNVWNSKVFANSTLSYTRYRYLTSMISEVNEDNSLLYNSNEFNSGIQDLSFKYDLDYYVFANFKLKFGLGSVSHLFTPAVNTFIHKEGRMTEIDTVFGSTNIKSLENNAYIEIESSNFANFFSNFGFRMSQYCVNQKSYFSFEPRLLLGYKLTEKSSLKLGYSEMSQFVHLLTTTGAGMPTDLWMPATDKILPSKSTQLNLVYSKTIKNFYEISIETYLKNATELITYKDGASLLNSTIDWQDKIETHGKGRMYGIELFIQKKEGQLTGWVGYTLSKSDRQFKNINSGKFYPFNYDRRHDLSLVSIYKINKKINVSMSWVYATGNAITLAVAKYNVLSVSEEGENQENEVHIYSSKNSNRMSPYHRLDIGINFIKVKKKGERTWNVSVYNVYNRKNPFYYFYETKTEFDYLGYPKGNPKTVLMQQSLFPIIPSVSYIFKF